MSDIDLSGYPSLAQHVKGGWSLHVSRGAAGRFHACLSLHADSHHHLGVSQVAALEGLESYVRSFTTPQRVEVL